jgi:hypothetical protein
LLLASGVLFCAGPARVKGPTLGISFRFLTPRAKENSPREEKLNPLQNDQARY